MGFSSSIFASTSSGLALKIESVTVVKPQSDLATTQDVIVTFNNPLNSSIADVCINKRTNVEEPCNKHQFFGEHLGASTPHIHDVRVIKLNNVDGGDGKTVTLTVRRLHNDERIDLIVLNVKDIYGNTLSSKEWDIWDAGARR